MNKNIIVLLVAILFTTPVIATGVNGDSASCTNNTLDTYSGTSNLSANWDANTIHLHWYTDETSTTELTVPTTSQTCVYDGILTPPPVSSVPQKTGYTFAGWQVRARNLFDQTNATLYKSSYTTSNGGSWQKINSTSHAVTYGMSVEPNTTYTIQKKGGNRLIITGFSTVKVPGNSALTPEFKIKTDINLFESGNYTFTTPANCIWILFSLRNDSSSYTFPYDVQIEKGSVVHPYRPYSN